VELRRVAADAGPSAHLPALALSLLDLGLLLGDSGRADEASATLEEAMAMWRRLGDGDSTAHLPDLAAALRAFAVLHERQQTRLDEALSAAREAADTLERCTPAFRAQNPSFAAELAELSSRILSLLAREDADCPP
jgi:tetratricopeptide (TPR) repeat protein